MVRVCSVVVIFHVARGAGAGADREIAVDVTRRALQGSVGAGQGESGRSVIES